MGVVSFHLCLELNEGAKVVNMLIICVDSPHLLHCPTIYLNMLKMRGKCTFVSLSNFLGE
jgi:hypothetical protein